MTEEEFVFLVRPPAGNHIGKEPCLGTSTQEKVLRWICAVWEVEE
jgi:hypothetical protein